MASIITSLWALVIAFPLCAFSGLMISLGYNTIAYQFNLPEFSWWTFTCIIIGIKAFSTLKVSVKIGKE